MIITSDRVFRVDTCILASYGTNFKFLKNLGYPVDHIIYPLPILKFKDGFPKDCHAVVEGSYWNTMIHREPKKDITKSLIATNVYYDNSAIEIEWIEYYSWFIVTYLK